MTPDRRSLVHQRCCHVCGDRGFLRYLGGRRWVCARWSCVRGWKS